MASNDHPGDDPQPQLQEGAKNTVTIIAINDLGDTVSTHFTIRATVPYLTGQNLLHYLEQAVEFNESFKFVATYFAGLGFFIDAINGVTWEKGKTYWKILSKTQGEPLKLGVSSYVPASGEVIEFCFTRDEGGKCC